MIAVIVIIGALTILIMPFYKSYKIKQELRSIYNKTDSIVKSLTIDENNNCYYEFDYINNKDADYKDLIIIRYNNGTDKDKYAVYLKQANRIIIDIADFGSTNSKKIHWVEEDKKSASYYIDRYYELEDATICQNLF